MKVVCAWCTTYIGEKEPLKDGRITHGICQECHTANFRRLMEDIEKRSKEVFNDGSTR